MATICTETDSRSRTSPICTCSLAFLTTVLTKTVILCRRNNGNSSSFALQINASRNPRSYISTGVEHARSLRSSSGRLLAASESFRSARSALLPGPVQERMVSRSKMEGTYSRTYLVSSPRISRGPARLLSEWVGEQCRPGGVRYPVRL